jgi:hypothetical protein
VFGAICLSVLTACSALNPALCRLVARDLAPYSATVTKSLRNHLFGYYHIGWFFNSWLFSL